MKIMPPANSLQEHDKERTVESCRRKKDAAMIGSFAGMILSVAKNYIAHSRASSCETRERIVSKTIDRNFSSWQEAEA